MERPPIYPSCQGKGSSDSVSQKQNLCHLFADHLVSTLKTLYEVEAPLSNKRTLQIQGESEGNTLESEFQDEPDSDSSEDQGGEDLGDEDEDENAPEEEEEEDSPFQKAGGELGTLRLDPMGRECAYEAAARSLC
ncbi:uncharacterized protein LOC123232010 isoform X2 [Gracilinanus agilis]|uniref:uncharacterized protein LOC123232010 isoform X2 n=1 Tax=Gracilinanus agilis TaxID=191870 RepID=UPI001CFE0766|nr:uncharacterized protein LOC123232010 isoform X2 [Gracilinanus agilis]